MPGFPKGRPGLLIEICGPCWAYGSKLLSEQRIESPDEFPVYSDLGLDKEGKDDGARASFAIECHLRHLLGLPFKEREDGSADLPNVEVRSCVPRYFESGNPYLVRDKHGDLVATATAHWRGDRFFDLRWIVEPWMYDPGFVIKTYPRLSEKLNYLMKGEEMRLLGAADRVWDRLRLLTAGEEQLV